ncbi:dethiobiotin synthase [Psychrobacter arenosus]|uniref:dethiobiotin synthase n=1 Tax=Psychrobacter arenosus TaxID=256326 RepID=UPI00191942E8|nr:dethiobiotin synthase [Psychrobacter arenosus]
MSVLFITGIDTDIGKTYATGLLAKAFKDRGCQVITQKIVQTGCEDIADDILTHRQIMATPLHEVDKDGTTCPYVFSKPASPHLSSALEQRAIDPEVILAATQALQSQYDWVLLEGAGGLMVPINDDLLTIDYVARQRYPVVLVTSGRLGSINHTLLSIEALKHRSLHLHAVIYNYWHPEDSQDTSQETTQDSAAEDTDNSAGYGTDPQIVDSTKAYLQQYLAQHYPQTQWIDLPTLDNTLFPEQPDDKTLAVECAFNRYLSQVIAEET